ncbi:MAG: LuxR family transcriptional regulator [Alphaproteobacteria bacterium]|nr:LuxR family transcriptional regulator [Alphaproteobacteria bacterium]
MQRLEQYIADMQNALTIDEAFSILQRELRELGFDRSLYGLMTDMPSLSLPAGHCILGTYPDDWMEYYYARNYEASDPVRDSIMLTNDPFRWTDMEKMVEISARGKLMLGEAHDATVRDGVGLGIHCPNGEVAGMGFASSSGKVDLSPYTLSILRFLGMEFHSRFVQLNTHRLRKNNILLTRRETEILMWMARGKTTREITAILSIGGSVSQNTVKFHQKNIYEKLEVNNQTSAVMKGFFMGILTRADLNNYI